MDVQWLIGIAVSVVAAAGGILALRRLWYRPRLYYGTNTKDFISRFVRGSTRGRIKSLLENEGLPTSACRVDWWNAGRGAASDITVDVETPGEIVSCWTDPGPDDVRGPYELTRDPEEGPLDNRVRIEQTDLKPKSNFTLAVGFVRQDEGDAEVRVYADGKEVSHATDSTRLAVLRSIPLLVTLLIALVMLGFVASTDWGEGTKLLGPADEGEVFNWRAVGVAVLGSIVVLPVLGFGMVRLMEWWRGWIKRNELLIETE